MFSESLVLDGNTSGHLKNRKVALEVNFKPIYKDVIEEIDAGGLEDGKLVFAKSNVKVLILKNCPSLAALMNGSECLRNSQVFVVVVCLSGAYDNVKLEQLADKIATPVILQIIHLDSSRLLFTKKFTDKQLEEVKICDWRSVSLSKYFDFNSFCNLLHSEPEKFGKFSFNLVEMKIDTNACVKGKRLIDLAIEHGDLLVLKFLQLFQPDITAFNDDKERVLEIAMRHGNLDILRAVLEIPVEAKNFEAYLSPGKRQALKLMSCSDLSLLMIAARSGKTDVVRFLLKCGLDVNLENGDKDTASDFAWNNGHLDTVVELLISDGPFPYYFDVNQVPDSKLEKISEERYKLHEQIKKNQIEEVRKFVKHHPTFKCAYDNRSQCALVTALESKNFEIYSFLRSKGYTTGIDRDHNKFMLPLTASEKEMLKLSNRKYFPTNEDSHIMDLLSRSRFGFGSEQKNIGIVQKYYETLDAIPEVQPILKIISLAKKLDIVFDFNKASIADMDPTQNFKDITVAGRTTYNNGNILIGARSSVAKVLATIAHEFTHYAIHLLYDNEGLPYHATGDESREKVFAEIVDFCEVNQSRNAVIENVFTYPGDEIAVELIVRVPHLLALHIEEPTEVAQVRKDFGNLFEFFTERVLLECKQEIPIMTAKQRIRDLNKFLGLKRKAEASNLFCDNSKIDFDEIVGKSENILIQSDFPNLVLCNVLNSFKKSGIRNADSLHIFIKLEQFMDSELSDMIREAFNSVTEPKLFILETENVTAFTKFRRMFNDQMWRSKVVFIAKSVLTEEEDDDKFNAGFPIQPKKVEYSWCDLNETSQAEILSQKLQFQGLEVCLSDVLTADAKILQDLSLEEVFKLPEMKLKTFNESVPLSPEIYIKRTFENTSNETAAPLMTEHVIDLLVAERSLILADDSGMGKTTFALLFARKLKQRNQHSWVVYIDLKQHTGEYYIEDDFFSFDEITPDFFSDKILRLNSLEMRFFDHFYENEKVIFIIDGFDEICPDYEKCILDVVETIQWSRNLLLVTTRTHLTKVLEESLSSAVIKLQQFTIDNQVELLVKFWSQSNSRPTHVFETKAESLLEKFRETTTQEDFFGVPLQVRMLALIYDGLDLSQAEIRELNIFSLYTNFIKKKIEILLDKGRMISGHIVNLLTSRSLNIMLIHDKLAIENFFLENISEALELPDIEGSLTDELLVRIGLLQVNGSRKFLFTHQSLSEYFLADFVLSNATTKTWLARTEELHQMFLEILHDEKFEKVRSFMNGKLEMKEKLNVDILSAKLEKSLELNRQFLLKLVKENLSALMTFMLATVKISKACKLSLLNQRSQHGDGSLHIAAAFSSLNTFKRLWICIESFTEKDEQTELLFSTGFQNRNVLNCAILSDNNEVSREILEIASNLMDSTLFRKFLMQEDSCKSNSLNLASEGHPLAFDMVWKAAESKLGLQDQKDLLFWQELNGCNVLHNAARCNCQEVIQSIMRSTKNVFSQEENRKFLFLEDYYCDTILPYAAYYCNFEVFTLIWNFIKDVLNRTDQKILWQNKYDANIFMRCLEGSLYSNNICAKDVIAASKEILEPQEIRDAMTERNFRNESFISVAVDRGYVDRSFHPEDMEWVVGEYEAYKQSISSPLDGNIELNSIVQDLRDALKEDLGAEMLKATLYADPGFGDTVMHFALEFGSSFLADRIFDLVDMRFNRSERLELIQTKSRSGRSILNRSATNELSGVIDCVCNFIMRQSDLVSDVKALFFIPDHYGWNFFPNAAFHGNSCLFVVLDWFKENSSHDDLRKVFFEPNIESEILAHVVVLRCDEATTKKFFDFCSSSFDSVELKEMIQIRSHDDHNILRRSLFNTMGTVVSEVWNFHVQKLTGAELEASLFKNNQGRVYFKKEEYKNPGAIETLKAIVVERYGADKARKIIR